MSIRANDSDAILDIEAKAGGVFSPNPRSLSIGDGRGHKLPPYAGLKLFPPPINRPLAASQLSCQFPRTKLLE